MNYLYCVWCVSATQSKSESQATARNFLHKLTFVRVALDKATASKFAFMCGYKFAGKVGGGEVELMEIPDHSKIVNLCEIAFVPLSICSIDIMVTCE